MFTVYDLSDLFGLAIVGFNSCDEIDARLQKGKPISLDRRARLNTDAVYNAKSEMDSIMNSPNLLRIAVFHHNIRSVDYREDYLAPMYVNILKQQRYNLCLHGHVHTLSRDSLDTVRAQALPIVGAGSLAAPYTERPPSAPMGYNLIVVARHTKGIWCHTRRCDESTLVWEADYRWGGRPFFSACSP